MERVSMKYGKHGVKEEDFGGIYPCCLEMERDWIWGRNTESGETPKWSLLISLLWGRDFLLGFIITWMKSLPGLYTFCACQVIFNF